MEVPKKYVAAVEEQKIRDFWEKTKVFAFDPQSKKPIYSIDTPPPTMSGKMHIGHACSYSQQDTIARYKRLRGFEVFYPFGTDDNGLPTEKLVQKEKKVLASKMERQAFIDLCNAFLKEERPKFVQDWKNIGISADFDNAYSTIDNHSRKIAQRTFLELVNKKLVTRKEAPIIWDTYFQSAIAQAELEDVEKESTFNDIVFTCQGKELIIATTRPELLGACVAIFAHPDDKRYKPLFGKTATSPLYNVEVPILADKHADPEKGTGIVMCCTFGDQTDIEWYKKHNLPLRMVITPDGRMNEKAGAYQGLKIEDAREKIIEDLKKAGLLKKQEKITHTVNVGERSGRPVEIINSKQWYVTYLDKRDDMLKGSEELEWFPPFMKHRLDNWIKNLNWDWGISRQRHFGIPIPAWYDKKGNVYYPTESQLPVDPLKDRPEGVDASIELIPEKDVFDTWFTSASSPMLAIEKMDEQMQKKLFPMDLRPQAHDIITFWLFYTMTKSRLLYKQNPWKQATISGWVLDPKGKKMSKSKGNIVEPQKILDKYSADAIRYWAVSSRLGEDVPFQEKELLTASKLVTKIFNAGKFCHMLTQDYDNKQPEKIQLIDQWILATLDQTIQKATTFFDKYEYHRAKQEIEKFFWTFTDNYIEIVKDRLYKPEIYGEDAKRSGQWTIKRVFEDTLVLFAPILPFVTETAFQLFIREESINKQSWPTGKYPIDDYAIIDDAKQAVELTAAIRRYKSENQLSLKTEIATITIDGDKTLFDGFEKDICGTTKTEKIVYDTVEKPDIEMGKIKIAVVVKQ